MQQHTGEGSSSSEPADSSRATSSLDGSTGEPHEEEEEEEGHEELDPAHPHDDKALMLKPDEQTELTKSVSG